MQQYSGLIMLIAMFAIMYFMVIRPQQKKDKETNNMRNSLKAGDEVITIGGIFGTIVKTKEDRVIIAVGADKTKLEIAKWGISGLANPPQPTRGSKKSKAEDSAKEESSKPSPKTIKKLGQSAEDAAAEATPVEEVKAE